MTDVLEVAFQKREGTACYAPYVAATAWSLGNKNSSEIFKMRVDTGADISCVPEEMVAGMEFLNGRSVRIRSARGGISKTPTKLMTISIHNGEDIWGFRPSRGVLITQSDIGLLGMDILGQLSMLMIGETVILERKGN